MKAKVCLVGPQGVGKTSIASRIDETTISSQINAAGTKFAYCYVLVGQKPVYLQIVDISGEEKLRCMGPIYYKAANVALCVFDLASAKTFHSLQPWIQCVRNYASDDCLLIILGNKADLENRQVSLPSAQKYAESLGAKYFEVSALSGEGLLTVLIYLAKMLRRGNDCCSSYAAKRSIASNYVEFSAPPENRAMSRRFSFPLRRMTVLNNVLETAPL